jgi:hypothetical protein
VHDAADESDSRREEQAVVVSGRRELPCQIQRARRGLQRPARLVVRRGGRIGGRETRGLGGGAHLGWIRRRRRGGSRSRVLGRMGDFMSLGRTELQSISSWSSVWEGMTSGT